MIVFEYCTIIKRICSLCANHKEEFYCGQKTGENRIRLMKKCPIKKKPLKLAKASGRLG
jgi:hypothetical protein